MMRLAGKVAIISGAASGMGAEEARLFAREGAKVVVADVLDEDGRAVADEIANAGGESLFVHTDVTSEEDWQRTVAATVERFGRLDVLVNNAGLSSSSVRDPLDSEGWRRIMDVNATGVFLGTKYAIPAMRQAGGGAIVNISSIMGFVGGEGGHPAYHASKGAVRIFSKAAAIQYAPDKIRVNSVHPGFVDTPMTVPGHSNPDVARKRIEATPLGRFGTPYDIAAGCLYLASDESSWVTGSELVIDGGVTAN